MGEREKRVKWDEVARRGRGMWQIRGRGRHWFVSIRDTEEAPGDQDQVSSIVGSDFLHICRSGHSTRQSMCVLVIQRAAGGGGGKVGSIKGELMKDKKGGVTEDVP